MEIPIPDFSLLYGHTFRLFVFTLKRWSRCVSRVGESIDRSKRASRKRLSILPLSKSSLKRRDVEREGDTRMRKGNVFRAANGKGSERERRVMPGMKIRGNGSRY